jgi:hypothetical protein
MFFHVVQILQVLLWERYYDVPANVRKRVKAYCVVGSRYVGHEHNDVFVAITTHFFSERGGGRSLRKIGFVIYK